MVTTSSLVLLPGEAYKYRWEAGRSSLVHMYGVALKPTLTADHDSMADLANAFHDIYRDVELSQKYDLIKTSRINLSTMKHHNIGPKTDDLPKVALKPPKLQYINEDSNDSTGATKP